MTSQINPNNINGAYPVAGQDNNSQGFRDNFTNTKTNFQYAAAEITDLQSKAVLKAPLSGSTLNNNMLGAIISNVQLQGASGTTVNLGTVGGSVNIDFMAGPYQTLATNASVSFYFSNWPSAGIVGSVTVEITIVDPVYTLTLPSVVSVNANGIEGYNSTNGIITFAAPGIYTFTFTTSDNGSTVTIDDNNKQLSPLNASNEIITNGATVNLAVASTSFVPSGLWVATLPNGTNGTTKVFTLSSAVGQMVITVASAGWASGSGTMTFNNQGDSCILQFINGNWYCIGNNGVVFA